MRAPDRLGPGWGDIPAPASDTAAHEPPSRPMAIAALAGVAVATIAGCVLVDRKSRTQLIAPIDPNVETAAIFVGAFAGALLVGAVILRWLEGRASPPAGRSALGALAEPLAAAFCCVLAATWCARGLVELYAFAGVPARPFPAGFTVVGRDTGRHDDDRYLRLRFGPAGRVFSLPVPERTYDAAEPGETVTLPVETGRRGIGRMVVPDRAIEPADLHRG